MAGGRSTSRITDKKVEVIKITSLRYFLRKQGNVLVRFAKTTAFGLNKLTNHAFYRVSEIERVLNAKMLKRNSVKIYFIAEPL